jgi:hypothetical protein
LEARDNNPRHWQDYYDICFCKDSVNDEESNSCRRNLDLYKDDMFFPKSYSCFLAVSKEEGKCKHYWKK